MAMLRHKYKYGFTMIEIMMGLVIVGIVAAIALPNIYNNVQKSNSNEALTTLYALSSAMNQCLLARGVSTPAACLTGSQSTCTNGPPNSFCTYVVGKGDPNGSPHFSYTETITYYSDTNTAGWSILAQYSANDGYNMTGSPTAASNCVGYGVYTGTC